MKIFKNRRDAGKLLAEKFKEYKNDKDILVLALPRGGIPVAFEVAKDLEAILDIFIVRKLGVPGHEEYAMGAIATGGIRVLNDKAIEHLKIPKSVIDSVTIEEQKEIMRREERYRGKRPEPDFKDKTIILIDDGLATGSTMKAAVNALIKKQPAKIIIGVPVADNEVCKSFKEITDEIICYYTTDSLISVGRWYEDFTQTTDHEVIDLLKQARKFSKDKVLNGTNLWLD